MGLLGSEYRTPILIAAAILLVWLMGGVAATFAAARTIGMDRAHQHELLHFYVQLALTLPILLFNFAMNALIRRLLKKPPAPPVLPMPGE